MHFFKIFYNNLTSIKLIKFSLILYISVFKKFNNSINCSILLLIEHCTKIKSLLKSGLIGIKKRKSHLAALILI